MDLKNMRTSFDRGALEESQLAGDPLPVFQKWLADAVAAPVPEPNAMTLATVGLDGFPSTRVVLLKGCDAEGLVWFTNYGSRKARELSENPHAALQFYWPELERVVRVEGSVARTGAEESDAYFVTRPLDSRLGAWASPQSEVISSRAVLVANAAKASARFGLRPPRPEHWGGFRLVPLRWEFWQGRTSRLHDRVRYELRDGRWHKERLAP